MNETNIESMIPTARMLAGKYARKFPQYCDDFLSAALLGLAKAGKSFNPDLGHPFSAYSTAKMKGEIREFLRIEVDPLSRSHRQKVRAGLAKNIKEVGGDVLECNQTPDRYRGFHDVDIADEVSYVLSEMPAPARKALKLIFFNGMTQDQVAEHMGVSVSTVHNKVNQAIKLFRVVEARKERMAA